FVSSSHVDSKDATTKGPSTVLQIILGILTFGIIPIIIAILESIIEGDVNDSSDKTINNELNKGTKKINDLAKDVPILQRLTLGGNLIFDDLTIFNSGDVCVGIKGVA
ncbi:MAG: hypothetical protein ACRC3B_14640, partial [Bacteroidia bacterium]